MPAVRVEYPVRECLTEENTRGAIVGVKHKIYLLEQVLLTYRTRWNDNRQKKRVSAETVTEI